MPTSSSFINRSLLLLFFVISLVHFIAIFVGNETMSDLTKPFLISSLGWWFWQVCHKLNLWSVGRIFLAGLFFSVVGDTLLIFSKPEGNELFFLAGLASFLIAHLCYLTFFVKFPNFESGVLIKTKILWAPFVVAFGAMSWLLWPNLGYMKVPVLIYAAIILTMTALSLNMFGRTHKNGARWILIGAFLFVISDTFLALNKFDVLDMGTLARNLIVMATYLSAQYFLSNGVIAVLREQSQTVP